LDQPGAASGADSGYAGGQAADQAGQQAAQGILGGAGRIINALTTLVHGISQGGAALIQAIFSVAAQLIPKAAPILGPLGGLVGALFSLFSKPKVQKVEVENEPLRTFVENMAYTYAMHPASALAGGRARAIGPQFQPAQTVEIELKGEAGDLFAAKVATHLHRLTTAEAGGA